MDKYNKSSVLLLQEIDSGVTDPALFDKQSRQQCVELLTSEGYTQAPIAEILKCSEKTVSRDLKEIRRRNELSPDIQFAKGFIGDMFKKAMSHHSYLVRLARSKEASIGDKAQAESAAWRVLKELVEKLQSLGYLPSRPQEIVGDFFHHIADQSLEKSFAEARKNLDEVIDIAKKSGTLNPDIEQNVLTLQRRIEKAEIIHETEKLTKEIDENKEDKND